MRGAYGGHRTIESRVFHSNSLYNIQKQHGTVGPGAFTTLVQWRYGFYGLPALRAFMAGSVALYSRM